jgi:hypothetical protein
MIALSMPRKTRTPTTHQVRTQIKRPEKYINNLRMIPATQVYRSKVILPLFSNALTVKITMLRAMLCDGDGKRGVRIRKNAA